MTRCASSWPSERTSWRTAPPRSSCPARSTTQTRRTPRSHATRPRACTSFVARIRSKPGPGSPSARFANNRTALGRRHPMWVMPRSPPRINLAAESASGKVTRRSGRSATRNRTPGGDDWPGSTEAELDGARQGSRDRGGRDRARGGGRDPPLRRQRLQGQGDLRQRQSDRHRRPGPGRRQPGRHRVKHLADPGRPGSADAHDQQIGVPPLARGHGGDGAPDIAVRGGQPLRRPAPRAGDGAVDPRQRAHRDREHDERGRPRSTVQHPERTHPEGSSGRDSGIGLPVRRTRQAGPSGMGVPEPDDRLEQHAVLGAGPQHERLHELHRQVRAIWSPRSRSAAPTSAAWSGISRPPPRRWRHSARHSASRSRGSPASCGLPPARFATSAAPSMS